MKKNIKKNIKKNLRKLKNKATKILAPTLWKEKNELQYWKDRKLREGELKNYHYEYFYTNHFGIDKSFFNNKIILDLGCGPRGSLEWATNVKRKIGLDPLTHKYLLLGASKHSMEYINAPSEKIPLDNNLCDAVFSFNSLDHVENIEKTINEIKRILKPTGIFLLLVEVNHPPTDCEPHELNQQQLIKAFSPEFYYEDIDLYKPIEKGIYESIKANEKFDDPLMTKQIGYFSAKFIKA
jgi:ubiquinone/menaquinone biosynthesis C-methylase UbiE